MMLDEQSLQIAFPVLPAVYQRYLVLRLPALARVDQAAASALANAAVSVKYSEPDTRRNLRVISCSDPFFGATHRPISMPENVCPTDAKARGPFDWFLAPHAN